MKTKVSLGKVLEVSAYFKAPKNRDKIQFSSDEPQFAWVNMSRYHPTAQIRQNGPINDLMQI